MVGDGVTSTLHCEFYEGDLHEPDGTPLHCSPAQDPVRGVPVAKEERGRMARVRHDGSGLGDGGVDGDGDALPHQGEVR